MGFYPTNGIDRSRAVAVLYSGGNKTDVPAVEQRQLFRLPGSWIPDKEKGSHIRRGSAVPGRRTRHDSTGGHCICDRGKE